MKFLWTWPLLLLGWLTLAQMPTQTAQAATDATSNISFVVSSDRTPLPDTDVEPDAEISGPVIASPTAQKPTTKPVSQLIPSLGNRLNQLAVIGLMIFSIVVGLLFGHRLKRNGGIAHV